MVQIKPETELFSLQFRASRVRCARLCKKGHRWSTINPSTPGLDAHFITLKSECVSLSRVSRPSIECAMSVVSCLLLISISGSVSLSVLRKFVSASGDVFILS